MLKTILTFALPALAGISQAQPSLMMDTSGEHLPRFEQVLDAGFDPARKAEFDAFEEWARHPSAKEQATWGGTTCGYADHRSFAVAMVRAVRLSKSKSEAVRLWAEGEKAAAEGARRAHFPVDPKNLHRPTALGRELARRVAVDQAWRGAEYSEARSQAAEEIVAWRTRPAMCHVDEDNTRFMRRLVLSHGWPRISQHGAAAAEDAWLLVQHADADPKFQKQMLALMGALLPQGEVSGQRYATLYDRVATAEKRPQRYGTQFEDGPGGCLRPSPLENRATVDAARKDAGLPPIAEYAQSLSKAYKKPVCSD
jgi:hypothetical protein